MKKVIIEIRDGLIEVEKKPDDIKIVIKDYDTDGADEEDLKTDKSGEQYLETVY